MSDSNDDINDSNIKFKTKYHEDYSIGSDTYILAIILRFAHFLYACCILHLIYLISNVDNIYLMILTASIGVPLVVDNMRYGFPLTDQLQHLFSRIAFFSHEVLTPFSLIYILSTLWDALPLESHIYVSTVITLLSAYLSYLGLRRFQLMSEWKMVSYYGIRLCRPAHTSHAALIPIFVQVIGLILSGYYSWSQSLQIRFYRLFICQIIVFVGNGLLANQKILFVIFANLFEVIWLWSIIQSLNVRKCLV